MTKPTSELRAESGNTLGNTARGTRGADRTDDSESGSAPDTPPRRRAPRRVTTPAPAGTDPRPYDPPREPRGDGENDARLLGDVPPHW